MQTNKTLGREAMSCGAFQSHVWVRVMIKLARAGGSVRRVVGAPAHRVVANRADRLEGLALGVGERPVQ